MFQWADRSGRCGVSGGRHRAVGLLSALLLASVLLSVGPGYGADWPEPWVGVLDRNRDGEVVIACLGDSNTHSTWQHQRRRGFPVERGWCEVVGRSFASERVRTVNVALSGATALPHELGGVPERRLFFGGGDQLDSVLATEPVDVVLLAFGTNDLEARPDGTLRAQPAEIVDQYNRLARRARSRGVVPLVATTPLVWPHRRTKEFVRDPALIAETNERLAEVFPERGLLEFHDGFGWEDYLDHLHLNARGQDRRAQEARRALEELAASLPVPVGSRALAFYQGHWSDTGD